MWCLSLLFLTFCKIYKSEFTWDTIYLLAYQNGQIIPLNYEKIELLDKLLLKPYQTLAIYVS